MPALRASSATIGDLSSVLARSRVVAAEVVQRFGGGSVVLGLAGRKVAATSQIELEPGDTLLVGLAGEREGTTYLQVLQRVRGGDALLQALVAARLGGEGARMADQLAALEARLPQLPAADAGLVEEALSALRAAAAAETVDGSALRRGLEGRGTTREALLLAADEGRVAGALATALADEAADELAAALGVRARFADGAFAALKHALASLLVAARVDERPALAARMRALLERHGVVVDEASVHELLSAKGGALQALLEGGAEQRGRLVRLAARLANEDVRGVLLRAVASVEDEPARAALSRALDELEAEALLALVKEREGTPLQLPLPVPRRDAELHLQHRGGGRPGAHDEAARVELDLRYAHLGAVHADLRRRDDALYVRLACAEPAVAERLRAAAGELEALLASLDRPAHVVVACEVAAPALPADGGGGTVVDCDA